MLQDKQYNVCQQWLKINVKNLYLIFLLLLLSCVYPDIDSVPDFKNIKLTDQELLDLCNNKTSVKYISDKYIKELCKKINYNKYYRTL